jgi:hypothetical protein
MEEPMDCGESDDDLGAVEDDEATLLESVEVSGNHQPEDASSTTEPMKQSAKPDELAGSNSVEDADIDRIPVGHFTFYTGHGKGPEKVEVRATGEPSEPSFTRLGQLGVPAFTEHFTKMVTVAGGPVPSGDVQLIPKLNLRDCLDIRVAVAALNIQSNAAVQQCCQELDDQEGRGLLAADVMGGSS